MSNNLDDLIAATPAVKVTVAGIEAKIKATLYQRLTDTLTVCVLTLQNGFTVLGQSACASPENYSQEIGERLARADAFNKIWALEGYLLRETLHQQAMNAVPRDPNVVMSFEPAEQSTNVVMSFEPAEQSTYIGAIFSGDKRSAV